MQSAWNSVKEVAWRKIDENLFSVHFGCLGDWNKVMNMGPWLFLYQAVIMEEYDGFENPSSVVLDKFAVWARVMRLPDNDLHDIVVKGMCHPMGGILEFKIKLPTGYVGGVHQSLS